MNTQAKKRPGASAKKYPLNELFKKWLEELRDHARASGLKTAYVYGKALKSLQSCPTELRTPFEAKQLDNIGDGIVRLFDHRLQEFVSKNGEPTFENTGLSPPAKNADYMDGNADESEGSPIKKKAKRRSRVGEYVPGRRTGGYAIIRALYDDRKFDDPSTASEDHFISKKDLQAAAQRFCDESLTIASRETPYTAWSSVHTLIKHDLVRTVRAGSAFLYTLTASGVKMAERFLEVEQGTKDHKSTIATATFSRSQNSQKSSQSSGSQKSDFSADFLSQKSDLSKNGEYSMENDAEIPPLSSRIFAPKSQEKKPEIQEKEANSQEKSKIIRLGYIYLDGDGNETRTLDSAYVYIDENIGAIYYLIKTTRNYISRTNVDNRFLEIDSKKVPDFLRSKTEEEDIIFRFLISDQSDFYAPGIFESSEVENTAKKEQNRIDSFTKLRSVSEMDKNSNSGSASTTTISEKKQFPRINSFSKNEDFSSCKPLLIFEPDEFEILLCVDQAEIVGGVAMFGQTSKNRKNLLIDGFDSMNLKYVQRRLTVGDYVFIAKSRKEMDSNNSGSYDKELVLNMVMERKRIDDLASSIKDGRYNEQKRRLRQCGLQKVFYLVEGGGKSISAYDTKKQQQLRSAMCTVKVTDNYAFVPRKDPQSVATYLHALQNRLRRDYVGKRLTGNYADACDEDEVQSSQPNENVKSLPTFREFNEGSIKSRSLSVGEIFSKILCQIEGVSVERAEYIRKLYPTFVHLKEAYDACEGDEQRENILLENIEFGSSKRRLGSKLSTKIARFFCDKEPFMV